MNRDNENIFVFMPLVKVYSSEVSEAHIIYNKAEKTYTDRRTE